MQVMNSQWPPPHSPDFEPPAPLPATTFPPAPGYSPIQPPLSYDPTQANPPARPDYGIRRDFPVAALIVVLLAIAGVACGFLWHAVSARPHVIEGTNGSFQLPADTDKNYFGAEAAFLAVTAAAGVLAGIAVWTAGRRRGPAIVVALAIGSVAGGIVARAVGEAQQTNARLAHACGKDAGFDAICRVYDGHLHLRAPGLMLTWAVVSMAVFLIASLIADRGRVPARLRPTATEASSWQRPEPAGYDVAQVPPASPQGRGWPPQDWAPPPA
jgi:hypothetical protein